MSLLAVLPVLLLSFAVSTEAVARAFAPCSAVAVGFATAAVDISDIDFQNFCSALAVAVPGTGAATLDFSATTDGPVSIDGGVGVSVSGNGSTIATAEAIVNGETVVSASASSESKVAGAKNAHDYVFGKGDVVATSSPGFSLITPVAGADPVAEATAEAIAAGTEDVPLTVLPEATLPRPDGIWLTIVATDVAEPDPVFLFDELDLGGVFAIGLVGRATVTSGVDAAGANFVSLTSRSGDVAILTEIARSDEFLYIVYEFTEVSPDIFPGFDFTGTELYVQVRTVGFTPGANNIELGWGPATVGDITAIGGDILIAIRSIEALFFEILTSLEAEFGNLCTSALNIRTIEGDCNNLEDPERASAAMGLARLGGTDPAYPGGDPSIPAGPTDISPRFISNNLFTTSPGISVLEGNAASLAGEVATATVGETTITVNILDSVEIVAADGTTTVVPFSGFGTNPCEDLVFEYRSPTCDIDIRLKCSGERSLDIEEDPCGADTNRLFDPAGCVLLPARDDVLENPEGLTDLFFTFAQFIDHDYGLSPLSQINADQPGFGRLGRTPEIEISFPIEVPADDFFFVRPELEFTRAEFVEDSPVPTQLNLHSSFLDGSQIYGVDFIRARFLRSFVDGELALSPGEFPPFNGPGSLEDGFLGTTVENGPNTDSEFFVAGDSRSNEQILLQSMHVLFLREHNSVARELAVAFPNFDDESLYQIARAIVIAEYQCIVYTEWLPLLLGTGAPSPLDFVYDPTIDATVTAIFTTSAFRFGHSLVGTNVLRLGPGPKETADMELIPVRDVFFSPELFGADGIDPFVRGGAWHLCKELDNKIVDELRTFLVVDFPSGTVDPPLFDLMAFNINRARDLGLPQFNDIRALFGLTPYTSFSEFVADPNLADLASEVYFGDVEIVDSFFGGMVEVEVNGGQLGETFSTIVAEQFVRSRDGDRFFYTGLTFAPILVESIPRVQSIIDNTVTLRDIILRTTGVTAEELGTRPSVFQI